MQIVCMVVGGGGVCVTEKVSYWGYITLNTVLIIRIEV